MWCNNQMLLDLERPHYRIAVNNVQSWLEVAAMNSNLWMGVSKKKD